MQFGLMLRAQFPQGDDLQARFQELLEQARLADALGFDSITKGMHYSSAPWQGLQQLPFLSRLMAEAPDLRLNFGLSCCRCTSRWTSRSRSPRSTS